jgi:glycosyltransferase involved in cell wall biosynthesis
MMPVADALVDLSSVRDAATVAATIRGLVQGTGEGAPLQLGALTFALAPGAEDPGAGVPAGAVCLHGAGRGIDAAGLAIAAAALHRRALLVVLGPVILTGSALDALRAAFDEDPFHGTAIPRLAGADGLVRPLLATPASDEALPVDALPMLPAYHLLTEVVTPCFLVRAEVVANLGALAPGFSSARGAWLHYLARARRVGFRCVLVNRAVARTLDTDPATPHIAELPEPVEDTQRLFRLFPDAEAAREALQAHDGLAHEALTGRLRNRHGNLHRTLVLDARGVPDAFTGTTEAALGVADGLHEVAPDWRVTLIVGDAAARYHRLGARYPRWQIAERPGEGPRATLGLRLSQPWFTQELVDLHQWSWVNAHWILDNILLDVGYGSPTTLAATWDVLAETADAIVYDSRFTQERFVGRVAAARTANAIVQHFALHPSAYCPGVPGEGGEADGYLFVVGSAHDHKHVAETVEVLAAAFPFQAIVVLGPPLEAPPQVTVVPTGRVDPVEVARLYARARVVVFPSFYEGFGFPVLRGLSAGRPVVARRSGLLEEIACRYRGPGRLAGYTFDAELVEVVGRLLHDAPVEEVPLGTALGAGEEPLRWTDVARSLLGRLEAIANDPPRLRWRLRERRIAQLRSLGSG